MRYRLLLLLAITLLTINAVVSQTPQSTPSPAKSPSNQDDVVRTTTNLVQLDVVVTDKEGKPVVDLQPGDFELIEDKSKQTITNFSYITLGPSVTISKPDPANTGSPVAPAPIRPEQAHRTLALVVDDLGLSYESLISVKQALRKFVNEQMIESDLVAILRTSRGMGSLQQFTTSKPQLMAAIDGLSWFASGRSGLSPNTQVETQDGDELTQGRQILNEVEESRAAQYSVGTIQTLSRILNGLEDLPGRKSVMLFAESFKLFSSQGRNTALLDNLRWLTDQANRSSTVIYTIDASGLNPLTLTASDRVSGSTYTFDPAAVWGTSGVGRPRNRVSNQTIDAPGSAAAQAATDSGAAFKKLEELVQRRDNEQYQSRTVLSFLAEETGGTFTQNANDLSLGTLKMLQEQQGYYLIGYRPADTTIDPSTGLRRAHNVSVKLKRSGFRVNARSGYYGAAERAKSATPLTREQQLAKALTSPFSAGGIGVRLTPIFETDPANGPNLRVLLHVAAKDLKFEEAPDSSQVAVVDFLAASFGGEGRVVEQFADTRSIAISKDTFDQTMKDGLVFILNLSAKRPGPIQVRVAIRDAKTQLTGSANQFIEVPDLNKNNLTLSGVYIRGTIPAQTDPGANAEPKTEKRDITAGPARRRLKHGMMLSYSYTIYNAQLDDTKRPQLETQMRLFRDGKEVFAGKPTAFNPGKQTDMKNLEAGGGLIVGSSLAPGQYVLQVTVKDMLAKNKRYPVAIQWMDFDVVP